MFRSCGSICQKFLFSIIFISPLTTDLALAESSSDAAEFVKLTQAQRANHQPGRNDFPAFKQMMGYLAAVRKNEGTKSISDSKLQIDTHFAAERALTAFLKKNPNELAHVKMLHDDLAKALKNPKPEFADIASKHATLLADVIVAAQMQKRDTQVQSTLKTLGVQNTPRLIIESALRAVNKTPNSGDTSTLQAMWLNQFSKVRFSGQSQKVMAVDENALNPSEKSIHGQEGFVREQPGTSPVLFKTVENLYQVHRDRHS